MAKVKELGYRLAADILRGLSNGLDSASHAIQVVMTKIDRKA